jgi:hypothetical protein
VLSNKNFVLGTGDWLSELCEEPKEIIPELLDDKLPLEERLFELKECGDVKVGV